ANRVTTFDPRLEIGTSDTRIEVNAASSEILIKDGPLRGGNFLPGEVSDLPLISLDPLSLARTLPGVTQASGSFRWTGNQATSEGSEYAINGQRVRGNNYLLDGTGNNDMTFSGVSQPFNIADAVEEVSVQTGNFGVEFGRAGGGVLNVVTKSGTNGLHGTLLWRYQSQRFNSASNLDILNGAIKSVFSNNVFGFTVGGPVRKNRTFFFGGFQQNNRHATDHTTFQLPTADAVSRLRTLFPSNRNLDLYLGPLGDLRGLAVPFSVPLGRDPQTGIERGPVLFAAASYSQTATNDGPQWLARIDHYQSEAHRLSWRYLFDARLDSPTTILPVNYPGFLQENRRRHQNFLFADSYTFGPSFTNEFRFSYARPENELFRVSPKSVPLARTLPQIGISNVAAPGLTAANEQFYNSHDFLFQETQTKLRGRHAFRYGVEFARQLAEQAYGANNLGAFQYRDSTPLGYSAFANFLDDFSGPSGSATRNFGVKASYPNQFRQSYFFQDNWKATPALALTFGLRYENFGQPVNVVSYPAFAGFDPALFLVRNEVNRDDNNFGPAFGFAWSPAMRSDWLGKLFGDGKTVWRGGYQISYDAMFTQIISLDLASSTPNAISTAFTAQNTGRGSPNFSTILPNTPSAPSLTDPQPGAVEKDLRTPYTERWSFGFQRQLPEGILLDVSYVGTVSHKLATRADFNPRLLNNQRLYANFGPRFVRTNQGNSAYHALQGQVNRRFARGVHVNASYTWSRMMDSTSEGVGNINMQEAGGNRTSVPVSQGGLKLDRGLSDYDRTHRLTLVYLWTVPGPRAGFAKYVLGGWSIAGVTTFQSGTPYTVGNSTDRNNDTIPADRPDIGNPTAPWNSRGLIDARCPASYLNPDTGACVSRSDVRWIQGVGLPNSSTVGRNTLHTGGTNNFDLNLSRSFSMGERSRLEFRYEASNAFNHPQYFQVPARAIADPVPGRFLNRDF
ncbi:MAG: hypothetical protein M3Y27_00745, partial [Acidobacteriota bacterium]|nr:hypothetical protein [Acidobacteriota bacterium]